MMPYEYLIIDNFLSKVLLVQLEECITLLIYVRTKMTGNYNAKTLDLCHNSLNNTNNCGC